jgi:hypothetical protein
MGDIWLLAILVLFGVLSWGLLILCDRLMGGKV